MSNNKRAIQSNEAHASREASRLMSRREVASMLGVHTETIKRYQRRGILPAIILNSRLVRYERADVEKFLQSSKI